MTKPFDMTKSRRLFLQYLAGSPLLASAALAGDWPVMPSRAPDPIPWMPFDPNSLIESPQDAIDVFDFEPVAHKNVPVAHFGFMTSGADDDGTLRANRADIGKFTIRPRRMRDVTKIDTSVTLFGTKWESPFFACPIGLEVMYHPEGEIAVSKAAEKYKLLQAISTYSSQSVEDVVKARGGTPVWFQLYPSSNFEITKALVQRAERAGAEALVVTVDSASARKDETFERFRHMDTRICTNCHEVAGGKGKGVILNPSRLPMFSEIPAALFKDSQPGLSSLTWEIIRRLRDVTKMKILIKGIIDPEDAAFCVKYGADGVYVSNHGGRAEDTGTSTISVLPEVVSAVGGKIPVLVDSGFRRGMDIVKALAMGATAVGVGRPYIWGLGAFGQPGVERVFEILRAETHAAMAQVGAATIKDLVPRMIHKI
jgi:isopentenyl diphosphate isomerase/L-lactate dehydrogenase-like FMN-dependent dehydrogenase